MTNPRPLDDLDQETDSDQDVSRLLRLAGPRPDPPADVATRVHSAAHAAWRGQLDARRRRRFLLASAAGTAAVLAIVMARRPAPAVPTPVQPGPAAIVLERATGGGILIPGLESGKGLPMGSWFETAQDGRAAWRMRGASVRQDRGTLVRVLGASSLWLERGGLYVDGTSGSVPIEVHTAQGRVRELGTQFEVRTSTRRLSIRVREGRVMLLRGQDQHEVAAGSGLEASAGPVVKRSVSVYGPTWSWVEQVAPEFALEGSSLQSLVAWTARETGWRIRFSRHADTQRAASVTLHGSGAGLAPADALTTVLPACGFAWRREGGIVWIEPTGEAR